MTTTIQSRVMHYAHIIYQAGGCNWSEALQAAWDMHYLRRWLALGIAEFTYIKRNGDTRTARGTLCPELIPVSKAPKGVLQREIDAGLAEPNYKSIAYYDLDREAWRAFNIENFLTLDRLMYLKAVEA